MSSVQDRSEPGSDAASLTWLSPGANTWMLQEITTRLPGRVDPAREQAGEELSS
jgi:hypothetical protein